MARKKVFGGKRSFIARVGALPGGPFILLISSILIIGLAGFVLVKYVVPPVRNLLGQDINEVKLPAASQETYGDLTGRIQELLLTKSYKSVGVPTILGDQIYFTAGTDTATNNPRLSHIYSRDRSQAGLTTEFNVLSKVTTDENGKEYFEAELLLNDNIIFIDVNADYVAYFDGKSEGGGTVCAYVREQRKVIELKQVYYGTPEVKLAGDNVVWLERTAKDTDKLYMMNIHDQDLITLATFNKSPYGLSQPGVSSEQIVWADYNDEHPDNEKFSIIRVRSVPYVPDESVDYPVDMYVHDPVTNGSELAWTDGNEGKGATLYLSVDRGMPKKIATDVSYHGLGKEFLAWCANGEIWIYRWKEGKTYRVSKQTEMAILCDVSDHAVVWFDITDERRTQDIVKFAVLD